MPYTLVEKKIYKNYLVPYFSGGSLCFTVLSFLVLFIPGMTNSFTDNDYIYRQKFFQPQMKVRGDPIITPQNPYQFQITETDENKDGKNDNIQIQLNCPTGINNIQIVIPIEIKHNIGLFYNNVTVNLDLNNRSIIAFGDINIIQNELLDSDNIKFLDQSQIQLQTDLNKFYYSNDKIQKIDINLRIIQNSLWYWDSIFNALQKGWTKYLSSFIFYAYFANWFFRFLLDNGIINSVKVNDKI